MSAVKAGNPIWSYYDDYYQEDLLYSNEIDTSYMEAVQTIREWELQKDLDKWELWRDDPAFTEDGEDDEQ